MAILPLGTYSDRSNLPVYPAIVDKRPDKYSIGDVVEVTTRDGNESPTIGSGIIDHDAVIISISEAESIESIPDLLLALNAESKSASDAKERVKERSEEPPYYILFLMRTDVTKEFVVNGLESIKRGQ